MLTITRPYQLTFGIFRFGLILGVAVMWGWDLASCPHSAKRVGDDARVPCGLGILNEILSLGGSPNGKVPLSLSFLAT